MALPFTDEQRAQIRKRLFESAQRHALSIGVRKTSLDALTADAGISKSSFYKFYESKEQLFLEVAGCWEEQILSRAARTLETKEHLSNKARAAAFVFAACEAVHQLGVVRFMREDMPYLNSFIPKDKAREHCISSANSILEKLQQAHIRFTAPDDTVRSAIELMYLSILSISDLGENFFPALRAMVEGACEKLVA